jgi:hypothetical protein
MFDKAKASFASLFGELAEAQKKIDDTARKIVDALTRMIDSVDDEALSSRDALPGHDFSWHEGVARTLAGEGFSAPVGFEPREWLARPVELRALSEYALGDGGATVASWFATPATASRPSHPVVSLFTAFEDGTTFDTVAGGTASHLPMLHTERDELLPGGMPVLEVLARHRARVEAHGGAARQFDSIDAYLAARRARKQERTAFRRTQGLGLVERYITERFTGEKADVGRAYLDAIRKHPEWYKYAAATSEDAAPPAPSLGAATRSSKPLSFMMSVGEDGRRTLTTFGMLFRALPELLMNGVAANHSRAARVLVGTTARAVARERNAATDKAQFVASLTSSAGMRITVTAADAIAAGVNQATGTAEPRPLDVHLAMRGFTDGDEPTFLMVNPLPNDPRSLDERLREACAHLGVDVPAARGAESADDAMQAAHERARERLGEVRARWRAREASGEKVLVKMRATQGEIGEYVWLEVRDWRDGSLDGDVVTPAPRVGLAKGQSLTIDESQVYDQLVTGPSGVAVIPLTDVVASDYGRDI